MRKLLRKSVILGVALIIIAIWAISSYDEEAINTSSSVVSNTKIEWGVKRADNNEQPDLGETNVKLMEEYNRDLYGK